MPRGRGRSPTPTWPVESVRRAPPQGSPVGAPSPEDFGNVVEIDLGGGSGVGGEVSEGRAAVVACHGDRPSCRTTRSRLSAVTVTLDHQNGRVMGRVGDSASPLRFGGGTVPVQAGRKPPRGSRNSSRAKVGRRLLLRQAEPVSAPIGRLVSGVSRTRIRPGGSYLSRRAVEVTR